MNIVVVGAGLAAANAVETLRDEGYNGDITLLGAERHPPYERPPLSKGLLLGTSQAEDTLVHDAGWYADHGVDLRLGSPATRLDLDRGRVVRGEEEIAYDRLLLATGATPRRLPLADESGAEVMTLRTLDDAEALKPRLSSDVLIVGAGWIGLELASAVRQAGGSATVVENARLPLLRVLGPEVAQVFADLHRDHGVDLRLETTVEEIDDRSGATTVALSDGHRATPDLLVVAVGVEPSDRLASEAGLPTDNGVLVDARLRTADPHVYAVGDVASHDHPVLGRRIRVEHWDNAIHQGRHAARVMLGGDHPYERLPYFFTDQYDLGMEYVGHVGPEGYDEVVIRSPDDGGVLTALWLHDDRVVAGMHVNDWDAIDPIRQLVGSKATAALRDPDVPLAELQGQG